MKAVVYQGQQQITVRDLPEPKPRAGELVLRVASCGICETDVWVYRSGAFAQPGMVLGHMGGGEVVDSGPNVSGWKTGERVAVDPRVYCGHCRMCQAGHATMCETRLSDGTGVWIGVNAYRDRDQHELYHGMMAEYCVVPAYACYRVPDAISDDLLAAVEGTAFSVRCIRASGLRLGDNVVLFGAADYCLEWLQWAKHVGARRIAVVEPVTVRRQMAAHFGADLVVDPLAADPTEEIRKLMPFGADVVACYPNYPGALGHACAVARARASIQILICYEPAPLHQAVPLLPVMKELTITYPGLFEAEPWRGGRERGDYALAIEMVAQRRIDVESYVTKLIPVNELERIVDLGFSRLPEQEVKVRLRLRKEETRSR